MNKDNIPKVIEEKEKDYDFTKNEIKTRLEYLRGEIEKECISYEEIAELQSLADHIEEGDTLLLEWAGVPEADNKQEQVNNKATNAVNARWKKYKARQEDEKIG